MRALIRNGHVHLRWWEPSKGKYERKSLGIKAPDGAVDTDADWWKKTRIARDIRNEITRIESRQFAERNLLLPSPQPEAPRSIELLELLALYNETNRMEAGEKAPETLMHRRHAVQFALKFREVTTHELNRNFFLTLREWGDAQGYAPASLRGYFTEWRSLADFAIRKGFIPQSTEHPVRGIRIPVHYDEPVATPIEDQRLLLRYCYHNHPHLFRQLFFLRLSGARRRASTLLRKEWVDLTRGQWYHANTKVHRDAWIQLQLPLRMLFEDALAVSRNDFVFHYREGRTLWYSTLRCCEFLGIENINPHKWKANYLDELNDEDISDRLLTLAAHHAPHGESSVVSTHYSRSRKRLLSALDSAQEHWVEFYRRLPDEPWTGGETIIGNPG